MATATPHTAADTVHERRWWTLAVLCLSVLIVFGRQCEPERRAALVGA